MTMGRGVQRGMGLIAWLIALLIVGGMLFAGYTWLMLHWAYASGERAGWVQKLSKKGYVCKTWEGEMAMVSLPGSLAEKFYFTVPDDRVAEEINAVIGKRVSLYYEEHIWLPSTCFGETGHFVKRVKVIEDTPAPLIVPNDPGASNRPAAPQAPPSQ